MSRARLGSIVERLVGYGFSEIEAEVFVHLARFGPCGAKSVTDTLSLSRAKTYKLLKEMQARGFVEATLEYPMKFSARPLGEVLDSAVQNQIQKISTLEEEKGLLLESWKSLEAKEPLPFEERFQIVKGISQTYDRADRMLEDSVNQVKLISVGTDLFHAYYQTDFLEHLQRFAKEKRVLFLTKVTEKNVPIVKNQSVMEVRHIRDLSPNVPNFMMTDNVELIIFTKSSEEEGSAETTAMWTNSKALTRSMSILFDGMWSEAVPLSDAIDGLTSATQPLEEEISEEAKRINAEIENAKKELVSILQRYGFTASDNHKVKGKSGVTHDFDLKIQIGDRTVLMDFAFSTDPVSVQPVLASFVKKMDLQELECDYIVVAKPSLGVEARKLAKVYQIKVKEI